MIRTELRDFQREALTFSLQLARSGSAEGPLLAAEMGLGKTLVALAFALHQRSHCGFSRKVSADERRPLPVLVVAPVTVVPTWIEEIRKHVDPAHKLRVKVLRSSDGGLVYAARYADVVITNYECVRTHHSLDRALGLHGVHWSVLVLDEGHRVRNPDSQTFKAVQAISRLYTCFLSGTPLNNRAEDVLAALCLLKRRGLPPREQWQTFAKDQEAVRALLQPCMYRKLTEDVIPDGEMGALRYHADVLEFRTETERAYYLELEAQLLSTAREAVASKRQRRESKQPAPKRPGRAGRSSLGGHQTECRLACIAPSITNRFKHAPPKDAKQNACYGEASTKMLALLKHVKRAVDNGEKVLVFSCFVRSLELALDVLVKAGYACSIVTGKVSAEERARQIEAFCNDPEKRWPVFLISEGCGAHGITLTAATRVVILDPWYNPMQELQAIKRAHRIGQERDVTAVWLIMKGTVEERVYQLAEQKEELSDQIVDGGRLSGKKRGRRHMVEDAWEPPRYRLDLAIGQYVEERLELPRFRTVSTAESTVRLLTEVPLRLRVGDTELQERQRRETLAGMRQRLADCEEGAYVHTSLQQAREVGVMPAGATLFRLEGLESEEPRRERRPAGVKLYDTLQHAFRSVCEQLLEVYRSHENVLLGRESNLHERHAELSCQITQAKKWLKKGTLPPPPRHPPERFFWPFVGRGEFWLTPFVQPRRPSKKRMSSALQTCGR